MTHILARNNAVAKAFADGNPYMLCDSASDMFGVTTLHVMFDWGSNKSTCTLRKMRAMLKAQELNPRCAVVRHDKLMI